MTTNARARAAQKPSDAQANYGRPQRPRPGTAGPSKDSPTPNPKTQSPKSPDVANNAAESTKASNANP